MDSVPTQIGSDYTFGGRKVPISHKNGTAAHLLNTNSSHDVTDAMSPNGVNLCWSLFTCRPLNLMHPTLRWHNFLMTSHFGAPSRLVDEELRCVPETATTLSRSEFATKVVFSTI
ncbi:hypothetical protein GQ600_23109 [Phytophthora cactorum]|nr:hypothetical protein GQ600_23109 [Phytophthora cactorum]